MMLIINQKQYVSRSKMRVLNQKEANFFNLIEMNKKNKKTIAILSGTILFLSN